MSFIRYVEDKRYTIALVVALMLFVSLMMVVSADSKYDAGDILYTMLGCLALASIYFIVGYARRHAHYRELSEWVSSGESDMIASLPEPMSHEQRLYTDLAKMLHQAKLEATRTFHEERRDYRDFIMSWVHEVKLPITACHMLMRNSAGKSTEALVNKLEDEVRQIDYYVEQALYYSRIDSFSRDYLISEVSLNQIVRGSVRKYAKLFVAKRIRFAMWEEEHTVHSDSKWLGFIIDQIITNALKYTDHGGEIICAFDDNPNEKKLTIRDNGIGIDVQDIGRIFDKGFTGAHGRSHAKSTGMGLYLANQMALKLGHKLTVRSKQGEYTELTVLFVKSHNIYASG